MPYLRFAAAVPRIKHTNARPVQSNEEQMLHTCKLVETATFVVRKNDGSFITMGNTSLHL